MSTEQEFYKALKSHFPNEKELETKIPFYSYSLYEKEPLQPFVIYEDWWVRKPQIVLSKAAAILGQSTRIFARKTSVRRINIEEADSFLNQNHIYGTTKAKHKLGLYSEGELVAVATFSTQRNMEVGRSTELIRFCSKNETTIVGGLDKLIKHYIKEFSPNHIMTYIDKDWGNGNSFLKLGFNFHSERTPIFYYVNPITGERFRSPTAHKKNLKVKNRGSLKIDFFVVNE